MAICLACDAELDQGDVDIGDTIACPECHAEMEVISVRPLELELLDDEDDLDDIDDEDEDDEEDDEEDEDY